MLKEDISQQPLDVIDNVDVSASECGDFDGGYTESSSSSNTTGSSQSLCLFSGESVPSNRGSSESSSSCHSFSPSHFRLPGDDSEGFDTFQHSIDSIKKRLF